MSINFIWTLFTDVTIVKHELLAIANKHAILVGFKFFETFMSNWLIFIGKPCENWPIMTWKLMFLKVANIWHASWEWIRIGVSQCFTLEIMDKEMKRHFWKVLRVPVSWDVCAFEYKILARISSCFSPHAYRKQASLIIFQHKYNTK